MRSVLNQNWVYAPPPADVLARLQQQNQLHPLTAQIIASRQPNLGNDDLSAFLLPKLQSLPNPQTLQDISPAVQRLTEAIDQGETIGIFGDYDVDGMCATALMVRYFQALGLTVLPYIPNRSTEGYGPNIDALKQLTQQGADLIITVDCGSSAVPELEWAQQNQIDIIVTDHHKCDKNLPTCTALINPNRPDDTSPLKQLCGAGVALYLLMALNRQLRQNGYFKNKQEPDLRQWMDLVATATVADVVPLTGVNRTLVHFGLSVLSRGGNLGLSALAQSAGLQPPYQSSHIGFQIGPRLNAVGRLSDATLGVKLLTTEAPSTAQDLAEKLNKLNTTRRDIQKHVLEQALKQAEPQKDEPVILVYGKDWEAGVIGIVAGKLKEKFYRPTFVLSVQDNEAVGSGRSIPGIDLGNAVTHAREAGILIKGGGHPMAAGLTVETAKIEQLHQTLKDQIKAQLTPQTLIPQVMIDGRLELEACQPTVLTALNQLAPFGQNNPVPTIVLPQVIIQHSRTVGADGSHVQVTLTNASGAKAHGIAFGAMENELGQLLRRTGEKCSIAATLGEDTFRGGVSVQITDAMPGNWQPE